MASCRLPGTPTQSTTTYGRRPHSRLTAATTSSLPAWMTPVAPRRAARSARSRDSGPDRDDLAGELVTHDGTGRERAHAAAPVRELGGVEIRAADPAVPHGEDELRRAGLGIGHGLDGQRLADSAEDRRAHGRVL